jgi:enoyl-CoA hydratase
MIDAAEAERIGLVNRVVAAESLLEECRGLAQTILGMGPIAVGLTLDQVDRALDVPMDQALALEAEAFGAACASEDKAEGTTAFLEKRAPSFPGR